MEKVKRFRIIFLQIFLFVGCIIYCTNAYAVNNDLVRIKQLKDSITNNSIDNELRGERFMDLIQLYFRTNDTHILNEVEGVTVGLTFYSDLYFYHVFESLLQEYLTINNSTGGINEISDKKLIRLFLILCHKGNNLDEKYYTLAKNIITKKHIDCTTLNMSDKMNCDIVKPDSVVKEEVKLLITEKKISQIINNYLSLIYYCGTSTSELRYIRRHCLVFPVF